MFERLFNVKVERKQVKNMWRDVSEGTLYSLQLRSFCKFELRIGEVTPHYQPDVSMLLEKLCAC